VADTITSDLDRPCGVGGPRRRPELSYGREVTERIPEPGEGKRFLAPETLAPPAGYSHVVEAPAGLLLYISGQVPLDRNGELVGAGEIAAQTRQVFENLTAALAAAGGSWSDVVKLGYFLVDVAHLQTVRAIRDEYVDAERPPASTLVEVSRLFRDDVLIEVEAIAIKG
jgi:reactive intermediate/imine deaminase